MVKVKDYFDVKYGVNLEFYKMEEDLNGIPFVARTENNNGVVGRVKLLDGVKPNPANTISVAGGGSVMSSFLQKEEYYSGRDLYYLIPKIKLNEKELLYYCMCLKANAFRYSWGRQANKTLKEIEIPSKDNIPNWVYSSKVNEIKDKQVIFKEIKLDTLIWKYFKLIDYFEMFAGKYYGKNSYNNGKTPLISTADTNNGVMTYVDLLPKFKSNSITIGKISVSTFYQNRDFVASPDVTVLKPKSDFLNVYNGLFIKTIIEQEKDKWSYGKQIRLGDCRNLSIKLPVNEKDKPDWEFMENYIKTIPYSSNL